MRLVSTRLVKRGRISSGRAGRRTSRRAVVIPCWCVVSQQAGGNDGDPGPGRDYVVHTCRGGLGVRPGHGGTY